MKNIQRRNLSDSFAETKSNSTSSARDSFAFKQRMSLQGQWASEKNPNAISDDVHTKQSKTEITEEEDFTGEAQVISGETRLGEAELKQDINDL